MTIHNTKDHRILVRGELEIDIERGVVYFHASHPSPEWGSQTLLRICRLDIPKNFDARFGMIDITHMCGASFGDHR